MLLKLTLLLAVTLLSCSALHAQQTSEILFKSGSFLPEEQELSSKHAYAESELVDGAYFRIVQFAAIPKNEVKDQLKSAGIELLSYLPRNSFYARIQASAELSALQRNGCKGIYPIASRFKLSTELNEKKYPHWALFGSDKIELNTIYFPEVLSENAVAMLQTVGAEILQVRAANTLTLRISLDQLDALYALRAFYYFECVSPPEEAENHDGRTNHRSNMLATDYSSGLQFDGTGVTVMMQDDGYIGDHIDYEGRNDQSNCFGCTWADASNHGDHVAGTIMGAGNLNPRYKGMAPGAQLLVYSSSNDNYDDVPGLYASQSLVITSKSYSSGCNGGYDALTRQLDQQCHDMFALTHVFSAGNNGTSDCGYGAGAGWGNITGGHKSGKNVIAVGNLSTLDALNTSSSRGPATDGRIKPDICGVGTNVMSTISDYTYESKTGTSMSCPGVAGTVAQLYQAYRDLNSGSNPAGGLIKGTLLNTADDLGNPGPDFQYGWGRINAIRAYNVLQEGNYIVGSLSQGGNNSHSISVPSGVSLLKVMVYWTDYEGTVSSSVALVNDLNMQLTDPAMATFNPWVLDPTPNPNNLMADAVTGVDDLNNMEQVTLVNPLPGSYTLNVQGFAVPEGPQEYFIIYSFVSDEVQLTYPVGGEGLSPSVSERIRWDASEGTTDFTLEYTLNNGSTWTTIGTAPAAARYATWPVPSTLTGQARVRVSRGAQSDESDANFSIIEVPDNLDFEWSCPDSLKVTWDAVPGATSYEVYMLGAMYMDAAGTSSTNNLVVSASALDDNWFSVRSFGPNGARSERAIAVRKTPGEFGCFWSSPYAAVAVACDSISASDCIQVNNASINVDATATYLWYFPTGTPSTSTDENPTVCFGTSGYHNAALVVTNAAGSDSSYFPNFVFAQTALGLPYFEGFETLVTLNGQQNWSVYNPNVNSAFGVTTTAALSGVKCARLTNYSQNAGDIDELISGPVDLSGLNPSSDIMTISFRYSHRKRDNLSSDKLRFYAKNACDDTWSLKKTLSGNFLSTEVSSGPWTPQSPEDWVTVHVTNITSTYFTGDFRFKFNFENGGGNNLYIDDINIYAGPPSDVIVSVSEENSEDWATSIYPNPAEDELNVRFQLGADAQVSLDILDVRGRLIRQIPVYGKTGANIALLDIKGLEAGMYFLGISAAGQRVTHEFIVK